jgi:DNA-binding NarL/FixJ family response regulator
VVEEATRVRVVVADDHPIVRTGLVALLADQPDLEVVGQTGDGLEAVDLVERLAPDLLVVDLMLPGLSGIEVNQRVASKTRVLVLTLHANEAYAARVHADGAAGFVLKDAHPNEILRAVREVCAGRRHFPPSVLERGSDTANDPWDGLTDREKEVAQLTCEGRTAADVATRLGISARTVEVHRANVQRKLRVHNVAELVRYLVRRGILAVHD